MDIDIRRVMSKSPVAVVREALKAGRALPTFSGKFNKHDFTQARLFAVLTLKTFLKTDYRGVARRIMRRSSRPPSDPVIDHRPFAPRPPAAHAFPGPSSRPRSAGTRR